MEEDREDEEVDVEDAILRQLDGKTGAELSIEVASLEALASRLQAEHHTAVHMLIASRTSAAAVAALHRTFSDWAEIARCRIPRRPTPQQTPPTIVPPRTPVPTISAAPKGVPWSLRQVVAEC